MLALLSIFAVSFAAPAPAPAPQAQAEAFLKAWEGGDLAEAGRIALEEFERLEASPCAVSADAARYAFAAGIAARFDLIDPPSASYLFWASSRIDRTRRVLTPDQRRYVSEYDSIAGDSGVDDWIYLQSPYRLWMRRARGCPEHVPQAFPDPAPGVAPALYAMAEFRIPSSGEPALERLRFGYPRAEAEALLARASFRPHHTQGQPAIVRRLIFDPCYDNTSWLFEGDAPVCRQGATADLAQ